MGFILSWVAIFLLFFVHLVDFVLDSTIGVAKRHWFNVVSKRHFRTAFVIDIFANYTYQDTCFPYFVANYGCSICIKVCPFNREPYDELKKKHETR